MRIELTIVLAWTEDDFVVARERRSDLGERPELRPVKVARALVWLLRGEAYDLAEARKYAAHEGYTVLTFPTTEPDPLGRAKRAILE